MIVFVHKRNSFSTLFHGVIILKNEFLIFLTKGAISYEKEYIVCVSMSAMILAVHLFL